MQQFTGGKVKLGKPMKKESEIFYNANHLGAYGVNKMTEAFKPGTPSNIAKLAHKYRDMLKAEKGK